VNLFLSKLRCWLLNNTLGSGNYPGGWEVHNKFFTSAVSLWDVLQPGTSRDKEEEINLTAKMSLLVQVAEPTTTFINVQLAKAWP
jgi:hypothetical protein